MTITAHIYATTRFVGFHHWPCPTSGERAYLANRHRHEFHVDVTLTVHGDDRDVEFHDLRDFIDQEAVPALDTVPNGIARASGRSPVELGSMSCEAIARRIIELCEQRWPGRVEACRVSEDGENGAILTVAADLVDGMELMATDDDGPVFRRGGIVRSTSTGVIRPAGSGVQVR